MPEYKTGRKIWRAIYPMLIYLLITTAVTVIVVIGYSISYTVQNIDGINDGTLDPNVIAEDFMDPIVENALPIALAGYILSALVFYPIWRRTKTAYPRWNGGGFNIVPALSAAGAAIGLNALLSIIIGMTGAIEYFESYDAVTEVITSGSFGVQLLAVGIVGPVAEELCFRGITLSRLGSGRKWAAIIIQAVLFGIVHLNPLQGIYAALLGILFGYIVVTYRSLIYGVIAHIVFNTFTVFLVQAGDMNETVSIIITLASLAVGAASLVGFIKCEKPEPYETESAGKGHTLDDNVW